jgi:hypothetical protein
MRIANEQKKQEMLCIWKSFLGWDHHFMISHFLCSAIIHTSVLGHWPLRTNYKAIGECKKRNINHSRCVRFVEVAAVGKTKSLHEVN